MLGWQSFRQSRSRRSRQLARVLALVPVPLAYPLYLFLKALISRPSPAEAVVPRLYDTTLGYYLEGLFRSQVQTLPPAGVPVPGITAPVTAPAVVRVIESGYPSGHALLGMFLYGGIALAIWSLMRPGRWRGLVAAGGLLLAASIGFVRVYMGVHYPSDVLGAWLLAIVLLAASERMAELVLARWK